MRGTVDRGITEATDPRQSPGTAFVNSPVEREFQSVLKARDPRAAAKALARQASQDKTGQAALGLKDAALDYLIGKASRGGGLSGKSPREAMLDPRVRGALAEILSPDEIRRFGKLTKELENVAMAALAPSRQIERHDHHMTDDNLRLWFRLQPFLPRLN